MSDVNTTAENNEVTEVVSKEYKTKSEIRTRKQPRINGNNQYKGRTIVALDGGYSSVKGVGPDRVFMFPSYAKKVNKDLEVIGKVRAEDIQFRDNKTGDVWLVGQSAEALMNVSDIAATTDASLYTRYRYKSDIFRVIMATGMCLGLYGTGAGNEIFLQTGLPAEYKNRDTDALVSALSGDYDISIKIGNSDWVSFKYTLDSDHIGVMEQPQGTLCAITYQDGVVSETGRSVMRSNSMIFDVGFGTEDIFSIRAGYKDKHHTYSDTGMRAVFEEVIAQLSAKYPIDIKIFEFQKYLESGKASYFNREENGVFEVDFCDSLLKENAKLCEKSMNRLLQEYDNMLDYQYLIVTGGTGQSRFAQIQKFFEKYKLKVLPGNLNTPDLPFCYSNVIGYYMFRHAKLVAELKKEFGEQA